MIAAFYSEMKQQGQSSRLPLPYCWWSESKCSSGAEGHAGKVKCGAAVQFPQQRLGIFPMGSLTLNRLSHSPQCSLHSPPAYSALVPAFPPTPPYHRGKPTTSHVSAQMLLSSWNFHASLAESNAFLLSAPRGLCLFLHITRGICLHTLCFLFHPFLILKGSGVRNSYSSHVTPHTRNSINIYWVNGMFSLNLLSLLIKATINSNHTGFRTSCTAQLQRALFSLPTM